MSTPITAGTVIDLAETLSGKNFDSAKVKPIQLLNFSMRWIWAELVAGYEGFADRETKIDSVASGDVISIVAGEGGADGSSPIVRGVKQIRAVYRALGAQTLIGELRRVEFLPRGTYRASRGVQQSGNTSNISRPGVCWLRMDETGIADEILVRPILDGPERFLLEYQPTAIEFTSLTDTLEELNAVDQVLAFHMGSRMCRTTDRALSNELKMEAEMLLQTHIKGYRGKREILGPDSTDKYYIRSGVHGFN